MYLESKSNEEQRNGDEHIQLSNHIDEGLTKDKNQ